MTGTQKHDRQIKVRLSAEQYEALTALSRSDQRPLAQYVRYLLTRHLAGES